MRLTLSRGKRTIANIYRQDYQALLRLLRHYRQLTNVTQVELARRLGKSQSYVQKVESGERRLDISQLRDLCQALDVDFVQFVKEFDVAARQLANQITSDNDDD